MEPSSFTYDIISLGEPLLRLSPPGYEQLRRASTLNLCVVGSQLNVAANMARLGGRAAFLTKVPENSLGWLAIDACRSYGVDVAQMRQLPGGKMGTTYVEFSAAPRAPLAVYDRAGSAASTIGPEDFPWETLAAATRLAYTDGIFPGLSASCFQASLAMLTAARQHNSLTGFDVNYREHLWTPEAALAAWSQLLPLVDILITNRNVSEAIFGYRGTDEEIMRRYADAFGCRVVCLTSRELHGLQRGAWSSQALADGEYFAGTRREFEIIDRYGTGDAWDAGFFYAYLHGRTIPYALEFGNTLCALAHTIQGDIVHVQAAEVEASMGEQADLRVRR